MKTKGRSLIEPKGSKTAFRELELIGKMMSDRRDIPAMNKHRLKPSPITNEMRAPMRVSRAILNPIAFALALFVQSAGYAQGSVEQDSSSAGTADQYAQCSAYFQIAGRVLEEPASGTYREYQYAAMMYSYVLAVPESGEDAAWETTQLRIQSYTSQMLQEINDPDQQIDVLVNRYDETCLLLMLEPPEIEDDFIDDEDD